MSQNSTNLLLSVVAFILGMLGVLVIKTLFEDDNSKIVSKKGHIILSDKDKMNDINKKIMSSETNGEHKEVLI